MTSNVGSFAYIIRGYMNRPVKLEKLMEEVKKAEEKRNEELREALLHAIEKFTKKKLGIK